MSDEALPTLATARLLLRPFRLEDAPTVQRLAGAREVAATTLTVPPRSETMFQSARTRRSEL